MTDAEPAARFRREPELFTEVHDRYFTVIDRALARLDAAPAVEGHEGRVVASVTLPPQLAAALPPLSQGERDVLLLVALGQLGYEEVAAALGISSGTVGSRRSRALRRLSMNPADPGRRAGAGRAVAGRGRPQPARHHRPALVPLLRRHGRAFKDRDTLDSLVSLVSMRHDVLRERGRKGPRGRTWCQDHRGVGRLPAVLAVRWPGGTSPPGHRQTR